MARLPQTVKKILEALSTREEVYVAGGPVRDTLLGRAFKDIDLTVPSGARELAKKIAHDFQGRLIILDEEEEVFRVAVEGFFLDFSRFRKGALDITEDLKERDFTINALAVSLKEFLNLPPSRWSLIDPLAGRKDLARRLVRAIGRENLSDDPLRMLRGYRLAAELSFNLEADTRKWIRELATEIEKVARERITAEIKALFAQKAGPLVSLMAEDEILFVIFPELEEARGVSQPSFHHLDVFGHLLLSLEMEDLIIEAPERYFGLPEEAHNPFEEAQKDPQKQIILRLAALFHDVGKPKTFAIRHRITFYEHDRVGAEIFWHLGERLRFPKRLSKEVAHLIRHHMRPFHLLREFREGRLTRRAMRRLIKDVPRYEMLFMVAMADSLASAGPDKEPGLEQELAALFWEIHRFHQETLAVQERERLVTGKDLIDLFGLEPGPLFRELLEAVEEARAEGLVKTREDALSYLTNLIREKYAS